jgi:hypothetical protein
VGRASGAQGPRAGKTQWRTVSPGFGAEPGTRAPVEARRIQVQESVCGNLDQDSFNVAKGGGSRRQRCGRLVSAAARALEVWTARPSVWDVEPLMQPTDEKMLGEAAPAAALGSRLQGVGRWLLGARARVSTGRQGGRQSGPGGWGRPPLRVPGKGAPQRPAGRQNAWAGGWEPSRRTVRARCSGQLRFARAWYANRCAALGDWRGPLGPRTYSKCMCFCLAVPTARRDPRAPRVDGVGARRPRPAAAQRGGGRAGGSRGLHAVCSGAGRTRGASESFSGAKA